MTDIVSTISKQFGKALILGTFFPAVVFVVLGLLFITPLAPPPWHDLQPLKDLDTSWRVLAVFFVTVVLSGVLYNLNIPLTRWYEGYQWQAVWKLGAWRTRVQQTQFDANAQRRVEQLNLMKTLDPESAASDQALLAWNDAVRKANTDFPITRDQVLPTRLGNTIRSFEQYPQQQYGMDAIVLWPRLIGKVDKDYAAVIDDAKTAFDFMLNCSALALLLALIVAGFGLRYAPPSVSGLIGLSWLLQAVMLLGASIAFYTAAISRAGAWGATVKAAFDLYRWDLLKQLGYAHPPATKRAERTLWQNISRQMQFGDAPTRLNPDYSVTTSAIGMSDDTLPEQLVLNIVRGIEPHAVSHTVSVILGISNPDDARTAHAVIVHDTPPDGFEYLWDSAQLDTDAATANLVVTGSGSYRFEIGAVPPLACVVLRYRVGQCRMP